MQQKNSKGANFAHTLFGRREDYADLYVMVAAYTQDREIAENFCQVLQEWGISYELCFYQDSPFKPVRELSKKHPSELVLIHDTLPAETIDAVFEDIIHVLEVNMQDLEEQWRVNICTTSKNFYRDFREKCQKETLLDKVRQHTLISSANSV